MAGSNIRGITIEFDANITKFRKQLNDVDSDTRKTEKQFKALNESLKLKFDDKKFAQGQKLLQQEVGNTELKVNALKKRLAEMEKAGISDNQKSEYMDLQTELIQYENELKKLEERQKKFAKTKLNSIKKEYNELAEKVEKVGKALLPLSAAAGAIATGLGALGLKAASAGADIDDLSQRFGVSAEKIQEWQYIALQTGIDVETFNKALIKARSAMLDLSSGQTNEAAQAIQQLGLSMDQFGGDNEAMFDGVLDALSNMTDETQKAALANSIFGDKIANEMLPLLNSSSEDLQKLKEEFAGMSSLSGDQVSALATLDDTLNKLKENFKYIALQIGSSLAPLIQSMAEYINNNVVPVLQRLANWFGSLTLEQQKMIAKILLVTAAAAPILLLAGKMIKTVGGIHASLTQLGGVLDILKAHPIITTITVVVALLALLYAHSDAMRNMVSSIMEIVNMLFQVLSPIIEAVSGLLSLLMPLLNIVLVPLNIVLVALQVPLKILATLLAPLGALFAGFGNTVKGVFGSILGYINIVLGAISDGINFVIHIINGLIDGVNAALGWLGIHIGHIGDVDLRVNTDSLDNFDNSTSSVGDTNPQNVLKNNNTDTNALGNTYNNTTDNSTKNFNITINTYNADVDADQLVKEINAKLAEAM